MIDKLLVHSSPVPDTGHVLILHLFHSDYALFLSNSNHCVLLRGIWISYYEKSILVLFSTVLVSLAFFDSYVPLCLPSPLVYREISLKS